MSEIDKTGDASQPESKDDGGQGKDSKTDEHSQSKTVTIEAEKLKGFEARVAKSESSAKEWKRKFEELEAQRKEEEAREQGKYEELLQEKSQRISELERKFEEFEPKHNALKDTLQRYYESEVENLPENARELIPESLSLHEKLEQAQKLAKQFDVGKHSKNLPKNSVNNPLSEESELQRRIDELNQKHSEKGLSQEEQSELIQKSRDLKKLKIDKA